MLVGNKVCEVFTQISLVLFAIFLCRSFASVLDIFEGSGCNLQDGRAGICKKIIDCESAAKEAHAGRRNSLGTDRCLFDGFMEIVCCPINDNSYRQSELACTQYNEQIAKDNVAKPAKKRKEGEMGISVFAGEKTKAAEFPYMVALGYRVDPKNPNIVNYSCGGTLISYQHVLTAAHCVNNIYGRVPFEARMGSHDLENEFASVRHIPIAEVITHPNYKRNVNYYDIAILKLAEPVTITTYIQPICLETKPLENVNLESRSLIVTGWGSTSFEEESSPLLLKTPNLALVNRAECAGKYTGQLKLPRGLDEGMICIVDPNITRGSDACQGDSGGPLLLVSDKERSIAGITSFGKSCGTSTPAVYTSVYTYLEWIEQIVWSGANAVTPSPAPRPIYVRIVN